MTSQAPPSPQAHYVPPANGWRTFLILWVTQSISVFGSALTYFALTIWLTQVLYPLPEQKKQLAFALSATGLAAGITNILVVPIAGAWADRHDRKRTLILMDFLSGLISILLVGLIITHLLNLWMLLVLIVLSTIAGAFHFSAFDTSYAMLVPEEKLPRANGMMQTVGSLSNILSPALAASLIAIPALFRQGNAGAGFFNFIASLSDGTPLAITLDAITFFVAAAVPLFLFIPSPRRGDLSGNLSGRRKSIWQDIAEGARYIWNRRPLLWLLGTFTVANLVGAFFVMLPLVLKFNLAADWTARGFTYETALALLSSVGGIGGVAGGVIISAWGGLKKRRIYGILVPLIIAGIAFAIFGLSPWLYLTAASVALFDGMTPFMNAHSQAIWQTQTPRELQGRVFSVRRVIAQFTYPLGTALAGVFGGYFNPGWVIAIMGIVMVVFCIAQLFNPYLLQVEDKAYLDGLALKRESELPR
jgi:DHA3 family macrolide efflux protein-like MFS transporter